MDCSCAGYVAAYAGVVHIQRSIRFYVKSAVTGQTVRDDLNSVKYHSIAILQPDSIGAVVIDCAVAEDWFAACGTPDSPTCLS